MGQCLGRARRHTGDTSRCDSTRSCSAFSFRSSPPSVPFLDSRFRGSERKYLLLLSHHIVEFGVVEQKTPLRRHAGDVLVTMAPADIAPGIDVTRIELLGGAIVNAADIGHQERVTFLKIGSSSPVERALLVNDVEQHPAQYEHGMLAAIEVELVKAPELVSLLAALGANKPKPRLAREIVLCRALA